MTPGAQAEALIAELGISEPADLDVEAIAFDAGVEVHYASLTGCEATLVGFNDRAVATINRSGSRGRERFSIAHEVGHWKLHRGKSFRCRVDGPGDNIASNRPFEREADTFASHLLMPAPIFNPAVKAIGRPGFSQLAALANDFESSLTASTLRLAMVDTLPVIVACYGAQGLKWHTAAAYVPKRWWVKKQLDEDTFAFDLLKRGKACARPGKQSADAWFENHDADEYEVIEDCVSVRSGEVLVLLYLANTEMLYAKFDESVGNRKYNETGSYVPKRS